MFIPGYPFAVVYRIYFPVSDVPPSEIDPLTASDADVDIFPDTEIVPGKDVLNVALAIVIYLDHVPYGFPDAVAIR